MNYQDCELFVHNLMQGNPGNISNTRRISEFFNNPHQDYRIIHVTGTNGKGTVSKKCASTLEKSGYKVGLFISPHIEDYRERITISSKKISKSSCSQLTLQILLAVTENDLDLG